VTAFSPEVSGALAVTPLRSEGSSLGSFLLWSGGSTPLSVPRTLDRLARWRGKKYPLEEVSARCGEDSGGIHHAAIMP
jgi:hypothetical protein